MFKSPPAHRKPRARARAAYRNMQQRCENKNGKNPAYANVRLLMSLDEWLEWAIPQYETFISNNPDISPAASRKNDVGDYAIGNIEVISNIQNKKLTVHPKKFPDVELVCPSCSCTFVRPQHYINSKSKSGHKIFCSISCGVSYNNKKRT